MVSSFFSHRFSRSDEATEYYAQRTLQKAANAARRAARKRLFMGKPAVGWGWKYGILSLKCPCGDATALDHRRCIRIKKNMKERKKVSYFPRGINPSLREAAKEFHKRRTLFCK